MFVDFFIDYRDFVFDIECAVEPLKFENMV